MLKDFMLEKDMEKYLEENNYQISDGETVDSTKVVDEAIGLGYESYMLDGIGELNETLIFIKSCQDQNEENITNLDKEIEKLIFVYKRGLHLLLQLNQKDVSSDKSYEDYVKNVVKKHLEIGKEIEKSLIEKYGKDINIEQLFEEL